MAESKKSHSLWVRGLKYDALTLNAQARGSHSLWVRGLKCLTRYGVNQNNYVALLVSAWIEI